MNQVNNISKIEENNLQDSSQNRFLACEEIVETLVGEGLPSTFSPDDFISKISKAYYVSTQEARTCLKLAVGRLETAKNDEPQKKEEKLNAQSGYFYPQGYKTAETFSKKNDGMDSLSSLGSYNKLMFGIR